MIGTIAASGRYLSEIIGPGNYIYDNISKNIGVGTPKTTEVFDFSINGEHLYVLPFNSVTFLEQSMSPGYNLTSSVEVGSYLRNAQTSNNESGIAINSDGSKFYFSGNTNRIYEYNFGTNFDIESLTFVTQSILPNAADSIIINSSGTKLYSFIFPNRIDQYNFGAGGDSSNLSFISTTTAISSSCGIFNSDGSVLYTGLISTIYKYKVPIKYDISTLEFINSVNISSSINGDITDIKLKKDDDSKLYVLTNSASGSIMYQFTVE